MEMEITWPRLLKLWWGFLWRFVIAIISSFLVGLVFASILTMLMSGAGAGEGSIRLYTYIIGIIITLLFSMVPLRLLIGKTFGDFKLIND